MQALKAAVWIMIVSAEASGIALALLSVAALMAIPLAWDFLRYLAASARRYFD